jgi:proteasome accessory factor C
VRLFRLDRVVGIEVLDVDGTPPADAVGRDVDERLFTPSPEDVVVTVDLEPAARWVATYYPVEHVVELGEGRLRVVLRAAAADWVPRLALRLGGDLRVVTPSHLADEVSRRAREALLAYSGTSPNV